MILCYCVVMRIMYRIQIGRNNPLFTDGTIFNILLKGAEETCIMRSQPKKHVKRALRTAKVAPTVGGKPVVPKPCTASLPESGKPGGQLHKE